MGKQLKSNMGAFCLVILLTVTVSVQVVDGSVSIHTNHTMSQTHTPLNPTKVLPTKTASALANIAATTMESEEEPELRMTQLAVHLDNQLMRANWEFRPTPESSDPTLIATAYGVILLRYFGLEHRYPGGAQANIVNATYTLSKTQDNQYWFVDQLDGKGSIQSTWAGIATLYTLNNLSLVDFKGVANYLEQFHRNGGYNETTLPHSLESTYWAIEILRLIDPLTPEELLTSTMKTETRAFIHSKLDTTKYRFDDPFQEEDEENYQLSTFYALMTLRAIGEHYVVRDDLVNIANWIASTQYFNEESKQNGGFAAHSSVSNETVFLNSTAAALASLSILNETIPENLFETMINTTSAINFIINCNLPGGGFTDRPGGTRDAYSLENIFMGLNGLLSSGKLREKLDPSPQFKPMPIVRGDNVTISYIPSLYGEGPYEGLNLEVTVDGRRFGMVNFTNRAYRFNLTRSDYPLGMFLGNHSLVAQMDLINQTLLPTFSVRKMNYMTVGLNIRYKVDDRSFTPSENIPFTGTLTDRHSESLSGSITATLVDPLGEEIAQNVVQASGGIFNGSLRVPNAPLLGNHTLNLRISYHTINATKVHIFDQTILTFIKSDSFEGNTSRTFHIGDNITLLVQVRYKSTESIREAFVRNLNGSTNFRYSNKTLFSGILNETDVPGYYNISGTIPRQLLTGGLNVTAEIDWPNIPATSTAGLGIKIVADFEITERHGFPLPDTTLHYGQSINWTFTVHETLSNKTIETATLTPGLTNMTSPHLVQEFSYSQANDTFVFTVDDVTDPNLPQGKYNVIIRGMLAINETYTDLLTPITINLDGKLDLQQIIFLNGQSVEPGQKFLTDFLVVNSEFNNSVISDLIFVSTISTISKPGEAYIVNLTSLGFYPQGYQLSWEVPEEATLGDYKAIIFRKEDMQVVGTIEFTVATAIPLKEPRPWQFYAVIVLGISEASVLLVFFRQILKERSK